MATVNNNMGVFVSIDNKTLAVLAFADQAYQLSDGLFDISLGILGRVWHLVGSVRRRWSEELPDAGRYGTGFWRFGQGVCSRSCACGDGPLGPAGLG